MSCILYPVLCILYFESRFLYSLFCIPYRVFTRYCIPCPLFRIIHILYPYLIFRILYFLSCIFYPVLPILYILHCIPYLIFRILYSLSCISYPVFPNLYSLPCISYPEFLILYSLSFIPQPVFHILYFLFCIPYLYSRSCIS